MSRTTFEPGPLAEVSSRAADGRWTLVFVWMLRHPPETVWKALTEPEELRRWAPYTADRDLSTTGEATLTMIDGETEQDLPARVIRAEAPTLLEHTWATDLLRWELTPTDTGTRLTLRHTVDDHEWTPKVAAGWHLCLVVAELLLEGEPIEPIRGEDALNYGWEELHDAYAAKLANP